MSRMNISEWALKHQAMVLFLIIVSLLGGIAAYKQLGRAEDPDYTFKSIVVRTLWPGATAEEVASQVTERIEKKLMETEWTKNTKSYSRPGESVVVFELKWTSKEQILENHKQSRKKMEEVRPLLPEGVIGPFVNDEFGAVQIKIWALTGDGYDEAELYRRAEHIARKLRLVPDVRKIELIGVQDEKIYVNADPSRMAALGLQPAHVFDALQRQNAVTPAGYIDTASERIRLHVTGAFDSADKIAEADLAVGGRHFRLGDIATLHRGLVEPRQPGMRYMGKPAIGIGVVMVAGGNVLRLGKALDAEMAKLEAELPAGIEVHTVTDEPEVVTKSFSLFVTSLTEAIIIVLGVSFLSLGMRTGTVVAFSIPIVLAITLLCMQIVGIDLHRVSLGALVIALGLLVDDAIIAVEMMVVKMEQGWDAFKSATFAYTSTAFPMLTGTLITVAGFSPVGFAKSSSGEYTGSIFWVISIALVVSWFVAVIFTPYIGYRLLDAKKLAAHAQAHGGDPYGTPFYARLRRVIEACLEHRWRVIGATIAAFVLSLVAFQTVIQKQFFPPASRPELMIDLWLPQGAAMAAAEQEVKRAENLVLRDPRVASFSSYVGTGITRFYLPLDQQQANLNFGQLMVVAKSNSERMTLHRDLEKAFASDDGSWAHVRARVTALENGPPVGFPVQFRVAGDDLGDLRREAEKLAAVLRAHPNLRGVNFDWYEKVKSVRVEIDQTRARALGVNSRDVALTLQAWLVGATITQYREGEQLIDVVWRANADQGRSLDRLPDLGVLNSSGRLIPLAQVAQLKPELSEGVIWRRDRVPAITVRADVDGAQASRVVKELEPAIADLRAQLPPGFSIALGGTMEYSAEGADSIAAVMPYAVVVVIFLLMMQLQNMSKTLLVLLTAPLGLIGVALALVVFNVPFGFVANLGVIALMGMILRNSVILVDQIDQDERAGKPTYDAIIDSTVRRFRPIVLTALAAVLAMVPLVRQLFWGPMAVAIMGGLLVATLLTCLFLPALYAAWYRVRRDATARSG